MRVALYPRVSGHEQEDNYSIPEQIDRMKKYCDARDWMVYKIYTDSGFTGSNLDRPGLQELIKDAESGKIDMVLVYKLDRLSRSQRDTLYLIEDVFEKNGVGFSSMTENFDTSTPFGKAILGVLAVFAQLEREKIKERTMMGKQARAEEGKWHGGSTPPIGYDYIDGELILNEYEAMQIKEAADLFLKHTPVRTIERMMDAKGFKHKYGDWTAKTIRFILSNPLYLGMMKHRDKFYQGTHTPIFTQDEFDAMQEIMDERREKHAPGRREHSTLLGGMLYCKHCGGKYAKLDYNGNYLIYSCYSRSKKIKRMIKDPNCKNKNYRMIELDAAIITEITNLSLDPSYIDEVRENKPINDVSDKIKAINQEIEGITAKISKLMDLYADGEMDMSLISNKVAEHNKTKMRLQKELDSLDVPQTDQEGMTNEQIQNLATLINDKDLSLMDKRNIVQSLIYYIEIDNEEVTIHWKF